MTIDEIVRAAAEKGLSYGKYVCEYDPPYIVSRKSSPKPLKRTCARCGVDISRRHKLAKYCPTCSDETHRERSKMCKRRERARKKGGDNR